MNKKNTWLQHIKIVGTVNTGFFLYYCGVPVFNGGMRELQRALQFLGLEIEEILQTCVTWIDEQD